MLFSHRKREEEEEGTSQVFPPRAQDAFECQTSIMLCRHRMHAKRSAHSHAGESQPLGYPIQLMNNSAASLMFNSVSEKLLTRALCQLPIASITLLSPLWEEMKCCLKRDHYETTMSAMWAIPTCSFLLIGIILDLTGLCKSACVCSCETSSPLGPLTSCGRWSPIWKEEHFKMKR